MQVMWQVMANVTVKAQCITGNGIVQSITPNSRTCFIVNSILAKVCELHLNFDYFYQCVHKKLTVFKLFSKQFSNIPNNF